MNKMRTLQTRIHFGKRGCSVFAHWSIGKPRSKRVLFIGTVTAAIAGDSPVFEVDHSRNIYPRDFNASKLPLTGYTSLRAAILALAHACGYPDAELPEGWTP